MSRCTFYSEYPLNRLLSELWVAQTSGNVWEFLVLTPFNLESGTLVVIVMRGGWAVLESLLVLLIIISQICVGWLAPSVVELKILVVQVLIGLQCEVMLCEPCGDVALFIQVFGPDLGNVKINKE